MSVFSKITSLLFEETVDEVMVEDQMEPIEIKEKPKPVEKKEAAHTHMEKATITPRMQQDTKVEKPKAEESKFVNIEIENKPKIKYIEKQLETTRKSIQQAMQRKEEKKEFEFSPVISPIFGSKEDAQATVQKTVVTTPTRQKKKNPLGTVISPYYGAGELEEFEAEAQEKIEKKENNRKEHSAEECVERMDVFEEVDSIALEDMLGDVDVQDEDKDDLMQISLFGESTPVKDTEEGLNI